MSTVPDFTPVMCPALSTVATVLSLLVHTNATLGIATESPGPRTCQAVAVATVSLPRIRILRGVMLTCTELSRSVGNTHLPTVTDRSEEHTSELQSPCNL